MMSSLLREVWAVIQPVMAAVGTIALGATAITGFAYWIFKTFSQKWLDNKFAKELEAFKHERQIELQRLRVEIDALLDRTIKLQNKELEVLPEAWRLLDIAFAYTEAVMRRGFRAADLNAMRPDQLELFLASADIPEFHKQEIRNAPDKTSLFIKSLRSRELVEAQKANIALYNYVMANGIFLQEAFNEEIKAIHGMIHDALVEEQSNFDLSSIPGPKPHVSTEALKQEGKRRIEALQVSITKRIWSHRKE